MQTIGKYVAALILALASSYFGPSEEQRQEEKEVHIRVKVFHQSPCLADAFVVVDSELLS